jgi:two-component system sensor histidine kinase and response regulator WspE
MSNGRGEDLSSIPMMDLFRQEAENQCAEITKDLLDLETDSTNPGLLESLMRAAHSIKGAARIVGLDSAVQIAHSMEDVFVEAQQGNIVLSNDQIDLLLKGVDTLNEISQLTDENSAEWLENSAASIKSLTADFEKIKSTSGKKQTQPKSEETTPVEFPTETLSDFNDSTVESPAAPVDVTSMTMFGLFQLEAENHSRNFIKSLEAAEKDPKEKTILQEILRAAHSIKGAAKIVELNQIAELAHAMEKAAETFQKNDLPVNENFLELFYQGVSLFQNISQITDDQVDGWLAGKSDTINSLIEKYASLQNQTSTVPPPVESPSEPPPKGPAAKPEEKTEQSATDNIAQQKKPARRVEDRGGVRAIRISAENMSQLMGLAGEVLIESRWLPSFSRQMLRFKRRQDSLLSSLDSIIERIDSLQKNRELSAHILELYTGIKDCQKMLVENMAEIDEHARRSTDISHRLYQQVVSSRMRPFSEGVAAFPRLVRDLARELNKNIILDIQGEDTPVDRDILEKIEAPLNHLVRNAIDHGIETPEERKKTGKPERATIKMEARHSAGMLNIIISDDGKGIDLEKIRATVIKRKLATKSMAADLTEAELLEFLFLPNFSTKKSVTKISGRGVGLDVVHNIIHEVRGMVRITTKLHKGTTFELQLPLTLSVLRALLIEINHEPYAIPLVSIEHVVTLQKEQIKEIEGRQYFTMNDRRIGLVAAQQIFDKMIGSPPEDHLPVVVFSDRFNQYGLIVDKFWGIRDLVVQKLDPRLGKIKDVSAAAILEDGTPVLIIDVEDLVRSMDYLISGNRLQRVNQSATEEITHTRKRILVADDSITVREVERKMLVAKGYDVDVAIDGMDAWNSVRNGKYDLVITDVDMPRMDGIELVSLIKSELAHKFTPVIIVSYKDREEDRQRGLEAGADYYMTKGSFHDETLVEAVEDLIGGPEI